MHPSKYQWQKIECIKISSSQNYHLSTNYPPWLITCIIVPSCGQSGVFAELPWPPCSEEANDIGESFSSKVFARWVIGTHVHVMYTFKYIIYMIQMIYTRIHGVHMCIYIYLCRYILYTWCVCLYSYMHSVYIYISENSLDIIYNSWFLISSATNFRSWIWRNRRNVNTPTMHAMAMFLQDLDTSKRDFTGETCAHVPWERGTCAWRFERIFHSLMLGYLNQKWWVFQQKIYPSTLPKFNMEPKNDGFQKESPIPGCHFQVPC